MTIEIGVTRIDQIMKKSSLNILVTAVFPLVLSGCSIVVFEDGEDCLAEMECPMAAVPSIDTPNETIAAIA